MADPVLALELLYDAVRARFTLEGPVNIDQPFGRRFLAQQHVGSRIVWVPGDPEASLGSIMPARNPGRDPRPLATIDEMFFVTISAQDPADPENERLQYRATRLLFDLWHRAIYLAAHGTYELAAPLWIDVKRERGFGSAIQVTGSIQAMVPDLPPDGIPYQYAPADAAAVVDVSELDNTETLSVAAEP